MASRLARRRGRGWAEGESLAGELGGEGQVSRGWDIDIVRVSKKGEIPPT